MALQVPGQCMGRRFTETGWHPIRNRSCEPIYDLDVSVHGEAKLEVLRSVEQWPAQNSGCDRLALGPP